MTTCLLSGMKLSRSEIITGFDIGLRTIMLRQKKAAATYLYQADCDGEWGEIQFDFEEKTAKIIQLADWDLMISQPFAKYAISYLLNCQREKLPKETVISFDA